ncbi:MAG: response regulator [Kiritimatiellaeota bacterium]|nr:response regulator [Kiritimatiellota bacterium]
MANSTTENRASDPERKAAENTYHKLVDDLERKGNPKSRTVLVVEDSAVVRKVVVQLVRSVNDQIVIYEAENGEEALEKLAQIRQHYENDPSVIITDLEMPVMDGWDLIENLRKDYEARGRPQGIPIVVLSSSSGERGVLFTKKSVHGKRARYNPIVTVAKESCTQNAKYDARGQKGVADWVRFFLRARKNT